MCLHEYLFTALVLTLISACQLNGPPNIEIGSGKWEDISPEDFDQYSKVRALTSYKDGILVGVGENRIGDSDLWYLGDSGPSQIGGDGLSGGWRENNKINLVLSRDDRIFVGLGELSGEIWMYESEQWAPILTDEDEEFGPYTYIYSGAIHEGSACFGAQGWAGSGRDTGEGPDILCLRGKQLTGIDLETVLNKKDYRNVYDMISYNGGLIAGFGNMYRGSKQALVVLLEDQSPRIIGGYGRNGSWDSNSFFLPLSFSEHDGELFVSFLRDDNLNPRNFLWAYKDDFWRQIEFNEIEWIQPEEQNLDLEGIFFSSRLINKIASFGGHLILLAGGNNGGGNTVWAYNTRRNTMELIGGYGINGSWDADWSGQCTTAEDAAPHRECTRSTWIYTSVAKETELFIGVARANGYLGKVFKYSL